MIRALKNIVVVIMVFGSLAFSQSTKVTRAVVLINATATVVNNLDLVVVKDLDFQINDLSATELTVDPQKDPNAGEIRIVGSPNSLVRLTYETRSILQHESGRSQLFFTNSLSGNSSDVQRQSILITRSNQIRLNDQGVYFVWIGGQLTGIENILPGQYNMDLTMQLDYVQ
jgi:hypothetical protein